MLRCHLRILVIFQTILINALVLHVVAVVVVTNTCKQYCCSCQFIEMVNGCRSFVYYFPKPIYLKTGKPIYVLVANCHHNFVENTFTMLLSYLCYVQYIKIDTYRYFLWTIIVWSEKRLLLFRYVPDIIEGDMDSIRPEVKLFYSKQVHLLHYLSAHHQFGFCIAVSSPRRLS